MPARRDERRRIIIGSTANRTERACLNCGRAFRSQGAHHRLCTPCRDLAGDFTAALPPGWLR